ncbi:MAG: multicopper oxidase domain-containing protein, partial [Desulfuromonadaceae bacterium]
GATVLLCVGSVVNGTAAPLPGGTLNPLTVPKYVTPLVIPPVMKNTGTANTYDIAVRQFKQQILPGGVWNTLNGRTDAFPATTVWSYGPAADPLPTGGIAPATNSQFNYPAYTVENISGVTTNVNWINGLKDPVTGSFLPHLLAIDQTLHWANPLADCITGTMGTPRTDCRGQNPAPYIGPVPIVTHVHGSHVGPESDGYPEAWWLPNPTGSNFLCTTNPALAGTVDAGTGKTYYVCQGTIANQYGYTANTNVTPGVGNFTYPNTQPSSTLWYHDHTLGMTRSNVYAGPAGFWLIREAGGGETGLIQTTATPNILPRPAPAAGETLQTTNFPAASGGQREKYREIPIVIQDRSFNADGGLFYPANRAFFEGLGNGQDALGNANAGLTIPFIPSSDISPIWNPEAFFNTIVVNGTTWPKLEVAPAIYRFRLLNGSNSRFLNLALFKVMQQAINKTKPTKTLLDGELPFFQIGAEQSLLPQVVMIQTGYATPLISGQPLPTTKSNMLKAAHKDQALLMGLAERADVLVDFRGLANSTRVRMINTAPDTPFGGFPDVAADPGTTGQVMEFVVNTALNGKSPTDPVLADGVTPNTTSAATAPNMLALTPVDSVTTYPASTPSKTRDLALIEEESTNVCVSISPQGTLTWIDLGGVSFDPLDPANACFAAGGIPFAPKEAVLGYNGSAGAPTSVDPALNTGAKPTKWMDPVVTNPGLGDTEAWELWNWTADAHPIHLHLVKFKVLERRGVVTGTPSLIPGNGVQPWETGWKDTVIAYPGEVTKVAATFDNPGLYVWHCHIVEHEDNEMMVPYCVGSQTANGCQNLSFNAQ